MDSSISGDTWNQTSTDIKGQPYLKDVLGGNFKDSLTIELRCLDLDLFPKTAPILSARTIPVKVSEAQVKP